jgi:hypothetical protein
MTKQYANLIHEWFEEVWNQRNTQTIDRLMAEDALFHGIPIDNRQITKTGA